MTITVTNYVTNYWLLDNIIDCSDIIEERLNHHSNQSNQELAVSEDESENNDTTTDKYYYNIRYNIRKQPCQNKNALRNSNTYNNPNNHKWNKKNVPTSQNYKTARLQ
jgi:hypothetical protein